MAVTKRLRFEVLRRDGFACRYCGAKAPDVELTVDHVTPKALGGTDTADNLVGSCRECNSGKASASPDGAHVDQVADDALRWAAAMKAATAELRARVEGEDHLLAEFHDAWTDWVVVAYRKTSRWDMDEEPFQRHLDEGHVLPRDPNWDQSIISMVAAGLPPERIRHLVDRAMSSPVHPNGTWKYFCGCCWREISELQRRAAEIMREPEPTA